MLWLEAVLEMIVSDSWRNEKRDYWNCKVIPWPSGGQTLGCLGAWLTESLGRKS